MGKRTNTARWTGKMWRIDVQQDGKRKSFYSSRPGRTGQREANAKADAWLDDGIAARAPRVADAGNLWLHEVEVTTCTTNYRPTESRWRKLDTARHRHTKGKQVDRPGFARSHKQRIHRRAEPQGAETAGRRFAGVLQILPQSKAVRIHSRAI